MLTISSLLAILLATFHLADDVVRGFEPGGFKNAQGIFTFFVWLFGTLLLAKRRSGYIVMLLGSILGILMTLAHMRGKGLVGGRVAGTRGMFFWVWTVYALGLTSLLSFVLSSLLLWKLPWRRMRKSAGGGTSS
jgi:hypothetical protein